MTTIGLSPKLYPALAGLLVGILVTLFVDRQVGLGIIATAAAALVGGYVAPPGEIAVNADPHGNGPGPVDESQLGYTLVEVGLFLLLVAIAAAVVVAFVA